MSRKNARAHRPSPAVLSPLLTSGPFSVPVVYDPPRFSDLEMWFGGHVDAKFHGAHFTRRDPHQEVKSLDRRLDFFRAYFTGEMPMEPALDAIFGKGFRLALYQELVSFGRAHREQIQGDAPLVAMGSVVDISGFPYAPFFRASGSVIDVGLRWANVTLPANWNLLVTRSK